MGQSMCLLSGPRLSVGGPGGSEVRGGTASNDAEAWQSSHLPLSNISRTTWFIISVLSQAYSGRRGGLGQAGSSSTHPRLPPEVEAPKPRSAASTPQWPQRDPASLQASNSACQ